MDPPPSNPPPSESIGSRHLVGRHEGVLRIILHGRPLQEALLLGATHDGVEEPVLLLIEGRGQNRLRPSGMFVIIFARSKLHSVGLRNCVCVLYVYTQASVHVFVGTCMYEHFATQCACSFTQCSNQSFASRCVLALGSLVAMKNSLHGDLVNDFACLVQHLLPGGSGINRQLSRVMAACSCGPCTGRTDLSCFEAFSTNPLKQLKSQLSSGPYHTTAC